MTKLSNTGHIRAVIFDLDGTIADSFPVFVRAVEYALNRRPFTPQELDSLRQHSMRETVKILKVSKWKLPLLVSKGRKEMDRRQDEITVFRDMPEVIRMLRQQGYRLYVVSSHSEHGITSLFGRYDLVKEFDYIYGNCGLISGKPRALRKLQRRFNYHSNECLFIGDEIRDIEAARRAQTKCIAVSWGFNAADSLQAHHPDAIAKRPKDIPVLIKQLDGV